ncbi:hypothetical protein HK101_010865 [Irineochytrium annulatum]|nr:hypothetical protein HK101_010865 [Irineochytrium annulatum]
MLVSMRDAVVRHYRDTTYKRTDREIEDERWIVRGVKFNRWILFPAAFIIQLCCGSLYAWSGYNAPIETALYGPNNLVDRGIATITFYIAVAVFGVTAAILGPWLERAGPRRAAILGAILFLAGNLLTALGVYVRSIWVVYIAYGVIGGAGLGISYISPVSPLQKWFPELRGLAAGLAVCGFGGGSILAVYTQKYLIGTEFALNQQMFLGVPLTFVVLGLCYFGLMMCSAMVLRMPPPGYAVKGITIDTVKGSEVVLPAVKPEKSSAVTAINVEDTADANATANPQGVLATPAPPVASGAISTVPASRFNMTLWDSLASVEFRLMYFMFFCSQITGLLVISKIQQITNTQFGKTVNESSLVNSCLGGANLLGRLLFPLISDLTGTRKLLFVISLLVQAVLLAALPHIIWAQSYAGFLVAVNVIAFMYGAGFGVIPAYLADQFGSKNVGATHGVILTAWALAGVAGGLVFTAVYNSALKATYFVDAGATAKTWHPPTSVYHVYDADFRWILAFVLLGLVLACLVPANLRDRRLPRVEGEVMRVRVGGRLYRLVRGKGIVKVSREEEDAEWEAYVMGMDDTVVKKVVE